jgi:hypothetical protein
VDLALDPLQPTTSVHNNLGSWAVELEVPLPQALAQARQNELLRKEYEE